MSMVKEFKEFAMRGNVVDLAVGVVIGGAFGKIVSSVVADVIMPPAIALARPSQYLSSSPPVVRRKAVGSAPSPVDSAVTHPYHQTCAADRPPYRLPPLRNHTLTAVTAMYAAVTRERSSTDSPFGSPFGWVFAILRPRVRQCSSVRRTQVRSSDGQPD